MQRLELSLTPDGTSRFQRLLGRRQKTDREMQRSDRAGARPYQRGGSPRADDNKEG